MKTEVFLCRPCLVRQTLCIVFDKKTKTELLKVSNRYLFPRTPFSFLDRIEKAVLSRFFGPMRRLFGQYKFLFENLIQNIYMYETS